MNYRTFVFGGQLNGIAADPAWNPNLSQSTSPFSQP
jgi:hypothetical protein